MSVVQRVADTVIAALAWLLLALQHWLRPLRPGSCRDWGILRRRKHAIERPREAQFLTRFTNQMSVSDILQPFNAVAEFSDRKAVILYCPGRIYDVEKYPFFYNAIFEEAEIKRTVRLCDFVDLLDGQKWPDIKLGFIWNVGRCGSTLLAQLFTCIPGVCVISEPDDFCNVPETLDPATRQKVMQSALKFHMIQCVKRYPSTKMLIIKPRSYDFWYIFHVPVEISTSVTHIFMYRDVIPVIRSFIAALGSDEVFNPLWKLMKFERSPPLVQAARRFPELREKCDKFEDIRLNSNHTIVKFGFGGLPIIHLLYRKIAEIGDIPIVAIKYEHLIENPNALMKKVCQRISPDVEVDTRRLDEVSKRDAQKNSAICREHVNKFKVAKLSCDMHDAIEQMMAATGQEEHLLPGLELPNTLKL